jgi:2-oxoglutarate ferredoxin oxidoreductase subunit delta
MNFWRKPLDSGRLKVPHGRLVIITERCKGCGFCVEYCPKDVLEISAKYNKKGYHYPEPVNENACVDCDLCENICPEFAVYSVPIEAEESPAITNPIEKEVEHK